MIYLQYIKHQSRYVDSVTIGLIQTSSSPLAFKLYAQLS